jgi:hypothetical protein
MQNVVPKIHGEMITHFFWFKINLSLDEEIQIVVVVFNFDFESEMKFFVPLCVHEKECA